MPYSHLHRGVRSLVRCPPPQWEHWQHNRTQQHHRDRELQHNNRRWEVAVLHHPIPNVEAKYNFRGAGMNHRTIDASICDYEEGGWGAVEFYPFETEPAPCAPAPEAPTAFTTTYAVIALQIAADSPTHVGCPRRQARHLARCADDLTGGGSRDRLVAQFRDCHAKPAAPALFFG